MYLHNGTGYANLFIIKTEGMKEIIQHLFQQCVPTYKLKQSF